MARRIVLSLTAQRRAASMILTYSMEPLAFSFLPGPCLDTDTSDWSGHPLWSLSCLRTLDGLSQIGEELLKTAHRRLMALDLPLPPASWASACSMRRRRRRRGAYSGVVTNLVHIRYSSHSQGPSCGNLRQRPSSSSVLKKLDLSQSTADAESWPERNV